MTENKLQQVENQLVAERNVSDNVLNKVRVLESKGNLSLPKNYEVSNALKNAWLDISQNTKLMNCTDASKATALLRMVTQGLDVSKNQGYFIPYGDKMMFQRSYFGNITMLKRDGGAKDVVAQIIYEGDTFKQELDGTGRVKEIKHEQDFFNINKDNIKGAYCTIVFEGDRQNYIEVMTIEQIEQAWMQSAMIKNEQALKSSKTHNNFKEEMAKKTVINRAAKRYINTSTDESLNHIKEVEQRQVKEIFDAEVDENQAVETLDIPQDEVEDAQYTEYEEVPEQPEYQSEQEPEQPVETDNPPF